MWDKEDKKRVEDHEAFHGMVREMARLRHSERKCRCALEGLLRALMRNSPFPVQAWHLMTNGQIAEVMQVMRVALGQEDS